MKITFLSADRALTKTYKKLPDGTIEKIPYPSAYEFTSHEVSANSLLQFTQEIIRAAKQGWCLLKGEPGRAIECESRAGLTNAVSQTEMCVFDTDGADFKTPDEFMEAIGLPEISYVVQYSASSQFKPGLHCHIFVFLVGPVAPAVLKQFCLWKNLTVGALNQGLTLTRTNVSLRFPLDITANQNDKLIYLGAPTLVGLADPHPTGRIAMVQKAIDKWAVPIVPAVETVRAMMLEKIRSLRASAGLPDKKFSQVKMAASGVEYMPNPGEAVVTETKVERGFVYLNLNGGDSWGYYYPENSPEYLFNFKGEPAYKLSEICPAYWSMLQSSVNTGEANSLGQVYLGICDKKTGSYHKISYDAPADDLVVEPARSKDMVKDFLKQHGQPVKDIVTDWSLVWDPRSSTTIDVQNKIINRYIPSSFMKNSYAQVAHIPPTINRLLTHVMGGDKTCVDYFCNWTAYILQEKVRTNTAWVLFGGQGTGKGVTFHRVLTPIFGFHNVVAKRMEELEGEFTGFMEGKHLVFIDEVQVSRSSWHQKVTAKLKNLIAEPWISIRKMYSEAYMAENYSNMIFASNHRDPLELAPDDRRFHVAPFQPKAIQLSEQDFANIDKELFEFYSYLMGYNVDETRARTPYQSEDRKNLIETSMLSVDVVSAALSAGNIDFFIDQLPQNDTPGPQRLTLTERDMRLLAYKELMKRLLQTGEKVVSRDDLYTLFAYCVEDVPQSPNKLTSYLRHHNVRIDAVWKGGKTVRGITVPWKMDPTKVAAALQSLI